MSTLQKTWEDYIQLYKNEQEEWGCLGRYCPTLLVSIDKLFKNHIFTDSEYSGWAPWTWVFIVRKMFFYENI